jgi:hypothetical protein
VVGQALAAYKRLARLHSGLAAEALPKTLKASAPAHATSAL